MKNEELQTLDIESLDCLRQSVGGDVWENFDSEVQAGVLTSEISRRFLDSIKAEVDFSAAVIPLMKVLECELVDRFYLPYLDFLKEKYTPETYIETNQLCRGRLFPNQRRQKILYYDKYIGQYRFCSGFNREDKTIFTIGNYQYTVGVEKYSDNKCDATATHFYRERIFKTCKDDSKIVLWICKLVRELDSLLKIRNDSAHGGTIQTINDAITAMDILVKVDKVLLSIIHPTLP